MGKFVGNLFGLLSKNISIKTATFPHVTYAGKLSWAPRDIQRHFQLPPSRWQ